MKYDILLVGAGLFSSTIAYLANQDNKKCLIIDKRSHIAGNIHCTHTEGIICHEYGPHIFHTNNFNIWKFVNSIAPFITYQLNTLANYKNNLYTLPFNLHTIRQIEGSSNIGFHYIENPKNLEEKAIASVGFKIYNTLIKGYTEKQWGRKCVDLPPEIITRIPVRHNYNCNYFDDKYQGIPEEGYDALIQGLIKNSQVLLDCKYEPYMKQWAETTVFTGPIDSYFDYKLGKLAYRSLTFENQLLPIESYQGNAIVNYTEYEIPYTRIIEHKYFLNQQLPYTIITKEYPTDEGEPYYPINDNENNSLFNQYINIAQDDVYFGGRLGTYSYLNMDQVIDQAFKCYAFIKAKDSWNKTLLKTIH